MKNFKNARLASVLTAGIAVSLLLAGCSGSGSQSGDQSAAQSSQSGAASASSDTSEPPKVDRDPKGTLPEITLSKDGSAPTMKKVDAAPPTVISVKTLEAGDGATVKKDDFVTVDYIGFLWDGTEFDSSYSRGQTATFSLNGVIPGWKWGLTDTKVGDTVMIVVPPEYGYGQQANGAIPAGSTLVFVVKVLDAQTVNTDALAGATPTDEKLPAGLTVAGDLGKEPQIAFAAGAPAPTGTDVQTVLLAKGNGPVITEGETVAYNLVGATWGGQQMSYWPMGPQSTAATGTMLLGQTIGSRIALITPSDGQSMEAQVVVVDLLAAISSSSSGAQSK